MLKLMITALSLTALFLPWMSVSADTDMDQCLLKHIATSSETMTIGELRGICDEQLHPDSDKVAADQATTEAKAPKTPQPKVTITDKGLETSDKSAITRRLVLEKKDEENPFALQPYKPNYIILSNNMATPNQQPFEQAFPDKNIDFQHWETKFQISLMLPLIHGVYDHHGDLYVAYTNRSFWQQFNKKGSSPFRDSDHEPEAWLSFKNDFELFGFKNSIIRTGIVHQSNGQAGSLSRSWNRLYADFIVEKGNWYFSLKPWWRIPENKRDDDNPDIQHYMGHFELSGLYKYGEQNFQFMVRNNLSAGDNRGAVQLGWSFPLTKRLRGYVQWFNGYGESLIDYNSYSNSIGFGIQLNDWL